MEGCGSLACTEQRRFRKLDERLNYTNFILFFFSKVFAILSVLPLPAKRANFPLISVLANPMHAHTMTLKQRGNSQVMLWHVQSLMKKLPVRHLDSSVVPGTH